MAELTEKTAPASVGKIIDTGNQYIHFFLDRDTEKTQRWFVVNKSSNISIAIIYWYGPWRQYIFHPAEGSIFNCGCLDTINDFIKRLNKEKAFRRMMCKHSIINPLF